VHPHQTDFSTILCKWPLSVPKNSTRISTDGQRSGAGFKLLKPLSSFRRLRILSFCRIYEVYSPRHALKVLLPTSKPCRPL
jgi:hypothetical protein